METCIYHSIRWMSLVETGWLTKEIYEVGGERIPIMIRAPLPRYRY